MRLSLVAIFLFFGCSSESGSSRNSITIFAAASLTDALHEVVRLFRLQNPDVIVHTHVGPTSLLARQIQHGAPADLFMAASPDWIGYLRQENLIRGAEIEFARNTLVVVGSRTAPLVATFSEISSVQHLAIADPSHVPAGVYSKAALACAGIWNTVQQAIIPTLDVRGALVAVTSGAADYAMVYGSDARLAPELQFLFQVPDSCMPEIVYVMCTLQKAKNPEIALEFTEFATDSARQSVWMQFGFDS